MQGRARGIFSLERAVGIHHRIHRTRARTGNSLDLDAAIFQKFVHHAPGKCAVRASSLQRQIDALYAFRRRPDLIIFRLPNNGALCGRLARGFLHTGRNSLGFHSSFLVSRRLFF